MAAFRPSRPAPPGLSRRTTLAGLGAGGAALALAAARPAAAQDATPGATAGHPLVGTWVIDRNIPDGTERPVVVAFTSDGHFLDPHEAGAAGVWEPTGPRSAAMTMAVFVEDGAGGYLAVRGTWEIDDDGRTMTGSAAITPVAPDGTPAESFEFTSRAARLRPDPIENAGTALPGFPTWEPAPPPDATPAS